MERKLLKESMEKITMPEDMRQRLVDGMGTERKPKMRNNKILFRKPLVTAATMALCVCLATATAMAATGRLQGIFRDITDSGGAITGQVYENATDEITMAIAYGEKLEAEITLLYADEVPYSEIDTLGIDEYEITDFKGKTLIKGGVDPVEIAGNTVWLEIPMDKIEKGEYIITVYSFIGCKKADQPLSLKGEWQSSFVK